MKIEILVIINKLMKISRNIEIYEVKEYQIFQVPRKIICSKPSGMLKYDISFKIKLLNCITFESK